MNCSKCGNEIYIDDVFCSKCGTKIDQKMFTECEKCGGIFDASSGKKCPFCFQEEANQEEAAVNVPDDFDSEFDDVQEKQETKADTNKTPGAKAKKKEHVAQNVGDEEPTFIDALSEKMFVFFQNYGFTRHMMLHCEETVLIWPIYCLIIRAMKLFLGVSVSLGESTLVTAVMVATQALFWASLAFCFAEGMYGRVCLATGLMLAEPLLISLRYQKWNVDLTTDLIICVALFVIMLFSMGNNHADGKLKFLNEVFMPHSKKYRILWRILSLLSFVTAFLVIFTEDMARINFWISSSGVNISNAFDALETFNDYGVNTNGFEAWIGFLIVCLVIAIIAMIVHVIRILPSKASESQGVGFLVGMLITYGALEEIVILAASEGVEKELGRVIGNPHLGLLVITFTILGGIFSNIYNISYYTTYFTEQKVTKRDLVEIPCSNCKALVEEEAKKCINCGKSFEI